jgi:hypothetical protein
MGNIMRSRAKWTDEEEKPSKYFLNLENGHYANKIIPTLIKNEGNVSEITNQKEILTEIENFYKDLYEKKDENIYFDFKDILDNTEVKKLNDIQRDSVEGAISYTEATVF